MAIIDASVIFAQLIWLATLFGLTVVVSQAPNANFAEMPPSMLLFTMIFTVGIGGPLGWYIPLEMVELIRGYPFGPNEDVGFFTRLCQVVSAFLGCVLALRGLVVWSGIFLTGIVIAGICWVGSWVFYGA